MNSAASIVRQLLAEAADLNRGLIGLELEFLVRDDLGLSIGADDLYSNEFTRFARQCGFNLVTDSSVKPRSTNSFETFYQNCEANSSQPTKWAKLSQGLARLLAWLKREDEVVITRGHDAKVLPLKMKFTDQQLKTRGYKRYKLPRARIPSNGSAGLHLHIDVNTWFSDAKHAKRFLEAWNNFQTDIPAYLPKQRYKVYGAKGHRYASLDPIQTPTGREAGMMDDPDDPTEYMRLIDQPDRYRALNLKPLEDEERGDIEFRFMHGTLNYETIAGWVKTIAEFVEYTRRPASALDKDTHKSFRGHSNREAPEVDKFLTKAANLSARSRDPMDTTSPVAPRATRRVFNTPVVRRRPSITQRQAKPVQPVQEPVAA